MAKLLLKNKNLFARFSLISNVVMTNLGYSKVVEKCSLAVITLIHILAVQWVVALTFKFLEVENSFTGYI